MVTQKQIADTLGISIVTVSRALRGHPDLAVATKERILSKASELGYPRNSPRAANVAPVGRIGVVLYQLSGENFLESELHRRIFGALETECRRFGVEVVLQFPRAGEIPLCVQKGSVDAVCLLGRYTAETVRFSREIPTLAVASYTPGAPVARVVPDNTAGIALATDHLLDLGHRRILMIAAQNSARTGTYQDRVDGYLLAMARRGLPAEVVTLDENRDLDLSPDRLAGYTAVVTASDGIAHSILDKLRGTGIAIPRDLSITGFDDLQGSDRHGLTTYAPDWEAMGRHVAFLLSFQPQETLRSDFHVTVPGRLIVRGSAAAPAA